MVMRMILCYAIVTPAPSPIIGACLFAYDSISGMLSVFSVKMYDCLTPVVA